MKPKRFTIDEFRDTYPDDSACLDKLFKLRFGSVTVCPSCAKSQTFRKVLNRRSYQCPCCSFQIYPTAGTVFEKTSIPLSNWFQAIYMQTTTRNGVSAKELERTLNVCYKTALRMAHQIKKLMVLNNVVFTGIVESDSMLIGGKVNNMSKKKRAALGDKRFSHDLKMSVLTLIERGSGLSFHYVVKAPRQQQLVHQIADKLRFAQKLYTDSASMYFPLGKSVVHDTVNHEIQEYARGSVHTNTVEGFFNLLKYTLRTHISVSDRHLPLYVNEVAFRYYHRKEQDKMFENVLRNVVNVPATA